MAIWDYQVLLFPRDHKPTLTEEGIDFIGSSHFQFQDAVEVLLKNKFITRYTPENKWPSFDDECYFLFDDGKSKVEIEVNCGTKEEKADLISIRTNRFKDEGDISTLIMVAGRCFEKFV